MGVYYVSLQHGLEGYYVKFLAPSSAAVSQYTARHFGDLAVATYSEAYFWEVERKRVAKPKVINKEPIKIDR